MVLVELPVLSFYTSLNGCFRELRNHAPVSINKSCSFEVFIMNDLFPNLVFISYSKDSCTNNEIFVHITITQIFSVRLREFHNLWVRIRAQNFRF